jgi:hypothetical protein
MRLTLLLFFLGQVLTISSVVCRPFRWYIRNTAVKVLIRTEDHRRARLFVFDKGKVTSFRGSGDDFDVALVFKDAATAFAVLTSRKKDASFMAAAKGGLRVQGMSFYAQWFEDATRQILG